MIECPTTACAGACIVHSVGGASALGLVHVWIQIRVSMMVLLTFFVFSVLTHCPRPIFPLFKLALRPGSTPDSRRHRSSISLPRNYVAFSFAKQVRFEHSIRSPSPIITSKREEKHPDIVTSDRQMTRPKVSPQFVVDRSSFALITIAASAAAPRLP